MNFKIAQVTLDGYFNYGNVLQRYAMCKFLESKWGQVDSIWLQSDNLILPYLKYKFPWMNGKCNFRLLVKLILNWRDIRKNLLRGENAWEAARMSLLKSFLDRHISMIYNTTLEQLQEKYDYFISGSDQVWNPNFANLDNMFLRNVPQKKRIAYAASISCKHIPDEYREIFINGVKEMQAVSVREDDGASLIASMIGKKVSVLLDPTMLISVENWRRIAQKPYFLQGDEQLLVTYFLGKRPSKLIEKVSSDMNLRVINILDENIFEHYVISPEEWLWLIDNAKLVYTDSFHGTVFSILFRTPFVVTERIGDGCESKMTSRIDTLLEKFGLEARRGTKENGYMLQKPMEIQYGNVEAVLTKDRQKAATYLAGALK